MGCGKGELTAELDGNGFVVQGLEVDAKYIRAARRRIRSQGQYGCRLGPHLERHGPAVCG